MRTLLSLIQEAIVTAPSTMMAKLLKREEHQAAHLGVQILSVLVARQLGFIDCGLKAVLDVNHLDTQGQEAGHQCHTVCFSVNFMRFMAPTMSLITMHLTAACVSLQVMQNGCLKILCVLAQKLWSNHTEIIRQW